MDNHKPLWLWLWSSAIIIIFNIDTHNNKNIIIIIIIMIATLCFSSKYNKPMTITWMQPVNREVDVEYPFISFLSITEWLGFMKREKWSRFVAGEFKPPKMGGKPVQQKIPDLRKTPLTCWNSANDQISVWTIRMLLPPNALTLSLSELLALKQKSWTLHRIYISYIQASIGILYT